MTTEESIETIWNYHHLNHELEKADAILVLSSNDPRVPEHAAKIYKAGWAPLVIFSGTGFGHKEDLLKNNFAGKAESEYFAELAINQGVPKEVIMIENKSRNTGQNFEFVGKMLQEKNLNFETFIVVQKPYMERRAYATGKKVWPDKKLILTSPHLSLIEWLDGPIAKDDVVSLMVGDLQRIIEYPKKGFQIEQKVPPEVFQAYEQLIAVGYTKHLIQ